MQVEKYILNKAIGQGEFCIAYEAIDTSKADRKVCVKLMKDTQGSEDMFKREIQVGQMRLKHPNVLKILGAGKAPQQKDQLQSYVVTELAEAGTIYDLVEGEGSLSEEIARKLFQQCVAGVQHFHAHGVAHRDVKMENFLLARNEQTYDVKLGDFGASSHFENADQKPGTIVGSEFHVAPEMLAHKPYHGAPADVFALGVTLWVMLTGKFPFASSDDEFYKALIFSPEVYFAHEVAKDLRLSQEAIHLLRCMFHPDPQIRLTIDQIQEHAWFQTTAATDDILADLINKSLIERRPNS